MKKLKPCPICGNAGHMEITIASFGQKYYSVRCWNCDLRTGNWITADAAEDAWNLRIGDKKYDEGT